MTISSTHDSDNTMTTTSTPDDSFTSDSTHLDRVPRALRAFRRFGLFVCGVCLSLMLVTTPAKAQFLDCSCLATQSVLYTLNCTGTIPDLCLVVSNCWYPPGGSTGFACSQTPAPGTFVTSNTPITFTLTNLPGLNTFTCSNLVFYVGASTNRFTLICPTNQTVACNSTNWIFYGPAGWSNTCCTNVLIFGPFITTNWPTMTAQWIGQACGVVDFCTETILFGTLANPCNCLTLICPSNIIVQTCLNSTAGTGFTNVSYPLPVVSNTCPGVITNLVCFPPSGSSFPIGTNTVTCFVQDSLGNSATCTFDIIVLGDIDPPIINCPPVSTVQCGSGWVPVPPPAFDACCSNNVFVMIQSIFTNVVSPCFETVFINWHFTDCNGNATNCTEIVNIVDTTPPVIVCNSNQTVQCGTTAGGGGGGWTPIPPFAFDTCCTNPPTVSLVGIVTNSPIPCNTTITLTWMAEDCCTNIAYCTEVVNITDTNAPVIICQPFKTIECGTGPNWFGDYPLAFDSCCGTNITLNLISVFTNIQTTCFSDYTLAWTATDCCTNTSLVCTQRLFIVDTLPPNVICASNITVNCGTPWNFTPPTAFDDCCTVAPTIVINTTVTNVPANCPTIITRDWFITDCCGNTTNCSQTVTIVDTTPPVIFCNSNQVFQCGTAWVLTPPLATDNCCTNTAGSTNVPVTIFNVVTNTTSPCNEIIVVTWQAQDCCGNKSFCTETISVVDTVPPIIVCNSNQTYQCGAVAGTPGSWILIPPFASDACCGTNITVSIFNAVTNGSIPCNQIITLTWQAVDCCTNASYCTETITITDTTPPVINCQPLVQIECGTGPNWFGAYPTVFDACCGTNITITLNSVLTNFTSVCFSSYDLMWQATDCCTNTSLVCTQRLTIIDTLPPNVICAPSFTVNCGTPWNFTPPTAIDDCCTNPPTIVISSTVTNGLNICPVIITRDWIITDCCGNSTNCSQTVTIVDNVPPVITCGPNQTVQCGTPWTFNTPTATDNCCTNTSGTGGVSIVITTISTNNIAPCQDIITVIWKATDCCGNASFCTNSVTVIDTIPPVITCPTNYTLQCGSPLILPVATDLCCPTPIVSFLTASTNVTGPCTTVLTITWQAMDCCTNTALCTNVVTIVDTTPPVLTCASNLNLTCGTPWTFTPPTATDLCCGTNVTVTITSTTTNIVGCTRTHTRNWQAVDCCSNTATCSQVVIVSDTTPPVATCAPNKTVQCGTAWTFDAPTAFDACCGTNVTITVQFTTPPFGTPCTQTTTRQWLISDCCGNSVICSQTVAITDTIPPTINCPLGFSVAPGSPWTFGTPTANDACCLAGITVMSTTTNVLPGCLVVHTRTWRAQDCCGNLSPLCSQSIYVSTTPPPNDLCQNPFPIFVNAPYICGSNICATPSVPGSLQPVPCGASANTPDVWYTVTAVCTGPMTIDTCGPCAPHPTFDTVLSAYTYTNNCNVLYEVPVSGTFTSCNDDCPPGGLCPGTLQSFIRFQAIAGQSYRIRVSGFAGATGWFRLRATQSTTAPVNDLCVNAIPITSGVTNCGTTLCGATPTPGGNLIPTPCGSSVNTPDVWYSFTPQCSGPVSINTCGSCLPAGTFDTVLSVYTGICPGPLNQVTGTPPCNDDSTNGPCTGTLQSHVQFNATAGVTYYIRVSGWAGSTGNFKLVLNQTIAPPPNDLCQNATVVNAGTHAWNTCGATTSGPAGPCNPSHDVWFNYTPNCSGTIMMNTCGSAMINTVLNVYSGPCATPTLVTCNDNATAGSCAGSQQSYVTFNGVAGTTYRIRVGGAGGAQGSGVLNIVGPSPLAVPTCGTGALSWRWFLITGPGNGSSWSWSISSPCCANLRNVNQPGAVTTAAGLAVIFRNSINAQCPGTALAFGPFLGVAVRCGPTAPVILQVGAPFASPLNMCVVGNLNQLPTAGFCSFNPEIVGVELTGRDDNNNGVDDYIDIATGGSADVNGNLVPDETETCFAPEVTAKPESQIVEIGQNVTLGVTVSGTPPFSYQWLLNGVPIPGAVNSTFNINPLTSTDLGNYSVSVSNACGQLDGTSAEVIVEQTYIPVITDASLADGWFRFMVETKIGFNYVIEYKNDLTDPTWTTLTNTPGIGAPSFIYDSEPHAQKRFYRVVQQPAGP